MEAAGAEPVTFMSSLMRVVKSVGPAEQHTETWSGLGRPPATKPQNHKKRTYTQRLNTICNSICLCRAVVPVATVALQLVIEPDAEYWCYAAAAAAFAGSKPRIGINTVSLVL